ncbi:MAG: hypothetical protein HZB59_00805 [Ignavibacteriales bacterium]|nr:hypothetical protein [Ignavibacteriales bacterium]
MPIIYINITRVYDEIDTKSNPLSAWVRSGTPSQQGVCYTKITEKTRLHAETRTRKCTGVQVRSYSKMLRVPSEI